MAKSPTSKEPALTERERSKKLQEQRDAAPKVPPNKAVKSTTQDLDATLKVVHGGKGEIIQPTVTSQGRKRLLDFGIAIPLDLSDHERWNNLCTALAEDTLLDETPPGSPKDVDRIRERIAHLVESHRRGD